MVYMVTFTISIPQMIAYIPYMDPMGIDPCFQNNFAKRQVTTRPEMSPTALESDVSRSHAAWRDGTMLFFFHRHGGTPLAGWSSSWKNLCWFGGLEPWNFICFHRLGMSSSQLTKSYFSEGLKPPTSMNIWMIWG